MSLFGGFFDEDLIFRNHMRQINQMMDPFDMLGRMTGRSNALTPFGFPNVNSIMDQFKMGMDDPNCHTFSSSTVMTMTNGPDGRPQIYQESRQTRCAPGGVKETKKAVCDSRTGKKSLAIGHHIGERGHVKERVHNVHSGEQEECEDFINLEEDEAETFNREWQQRARDYTTQASLRYSGEAGGSRSRGSDRQYPALTSGRYRPNNSSHQSSSRKPHKSYPALTYRSSDEPEVIVERSRKRAREPEATQSAPGKKSSKQKVTEN